MPSLVELGGGWQMLDRTVGSNGSQGLDLTPMELRWWLLWSAVSREWLLVVFPSLLRG